MVKNWELMAPDNPALRAAMLESLGSAPTMRNQRNNRLVSFAVNWGRLASLPVDGFESVGEFCQRSRAVAS
jgi:hypothetical protein